MSGLLRFIGVTLIVLACVVGYVLTIMPASFIGIFIDLFVFIAAALVVLIGLQLCSLASRLDARNDKTGAKS
jgi:hypothetical protein